MPKESPFPKDYPGNEPETDHRRPVYPNIPPSWPPGPSDIPDREAPVHSVIEDLRDEFVINDKDAFDNPFDR